MSTRQLPALSALCLTLSACQPAGPDELPPVVNCDTVQVLSLIHI